VNLVKTKKQRRQERKAAKLQRYVDKSAPSALPRLEKHIAAEINRHNKRIWRIDVPLDEILAQPCFELTEEDFQPRLYWGIYRTAKDSVHAWRLMRDRYLNLDVPRKYREARLAAMKFCADRIFELTCTNTQWFYRQLGAAGLTSRFKIEGLAFVFETWFDRWSYKQAEVLTEALVDWLRQDAKEPLRYVLPDCVAHFACPQDGVVDVSTETWLKPVV
jgi:hypothetical protein